MPAPHLKTIAGQKAATTVTDLATYGGLLLAEQADRMVDIIIEKDDFLSDIRVERMNSHTKRVDKVGLSSNFLQPSTAGSEVDYTAFDTNYIELVVKGWRGVLPIHDDVLEDNPEGPALFGHLEDLVAKKVAIETQELALKADTLSVDTRLQKLDGLIKQCVSHKLDHTSSPVAMSDDVLDELMEELPSKYWANTNEEDWRFYCNWKQLLGYTRSLGDRATSLGDSAIVGRVGRKTNKGIPLYPLAKMPVSQIIFTHKDNPIVGFRRYFRFRTHVQEHLERTLLVVSCRWDAKFENEDAAVLYDGLQTKIVPTS